MTGSHVYSFESKNEAMKFAKAMEVLLGERWKPFSSFNGNESEVNYGILVEQGQTTARGQLERFIGHYSLADDLADHEEFWSKEQVKEIDRIYDLCQAEEGGFSSLHKHVEKLIFERVSKIIE